MSDKIEVTLNDFYEMVSSGDLVFKYVEVDSGHGLSFSSDKINVEEILETTNIPDIAEKVIMLASMAGLKEPSEFYSVIEQYIKDEKIDSLDKKLSPEGR